MKPKEIEYKIRGRKRERCPKCGKLGVRKEMPNPEYLSFFHKLTMEKSYYGLTIPTITKSCSFKKSDYQEK